MASERMDVVHALMAASNAFNATLDDRGYVVYYGGNGAGAVYKRPKRPLDWPVASVKIEWKVKPDYEAEFAAFELGEANE